MKSYKAINLKSVFLFVIFPLQLPAILIFFLGLPLLIVVCWSKFHLKKIFHLQPVVLFSPLALPRNYLTAKAVRTQGWQADVLAYSSNKKFSSLRFGFLLDDHVILKIFMVLTDFLPIFVYCVIKYDIFEFSFWGGPLIYSKLRRLELFLLRILSKKIVVYGYGSDCLLLSEVKKTGKYNAAMDFEINQELLNKEEIIRQNIKRVQKYVHVILACNDLIHLGKKAIMVPTAIALVFLVIAFSI